MQIIQMFIFFQVSNISQAEIHINIVDGKSTKMVWKRSTVDSNQRYTFLFSVMIQIYDEPAEAIKTAHKKGKKLTSSQVFGIITVKEFQEHELLKNLDSKYISEHWPVYLLSISILTKYQYTDTYT
jgi:hypothetical protein